MILLNIIKTILPEPAIRILKTFRNRDTQKVFTRIYESGAWGRSDYSSQKFFSGSGSHEHIVVDTYIKAVQNLLASFKKKPNVVDIGCGDFFVGSQIRQLCDSYIACDIVEPLIVFNREKYGNLNVDFRVLDLTKDNLPEGEIVFVRQVFQHLSNKQIQKALPKITSKYKYLILTEHIPEDTNFIPNLDKVTGTNIRHEFNSGIILTSPPFNLNAMEEKTLCIAHVNGIIKTTLYRFS